MMRPAYGHALTRHIARKDTLRLRSLLGILATAIVVKLACGIVLLVDPQASDPEYFEVLGTIANLALFVEVVLTWFGVHLLVREDPLEGTSAFWRVRPIGVRRLLRAKLLAAVVLLAVLPVLLMLPWWLGCGFGLRQIIAAALETATWRCLVVALAFAPAVLCRSTTEFLLGTLLAVLLGGVMLGRTTVGLSDPFGRPLRIGIYLLERPFNLQPIIGMNGGVAYTQAALVVVIAVFGGLVIGIRGFLDRERARALCWAAVATSAAGLTAFFWPWDLLPLFAPSKSRHGQIELQLASAEFAGSHLWTRHVVKQVPPDLNLEIRGHHRWTWPNGEILAFADANAAVLAIDNRSLLGLRPTAKEEAIRSATHRLMLAPQDHNNPQMVRAIARAGVDATLGLERQYATPSRPLPYVFISRFKDSRPRYELDAWMTLRKPELAGERPLRAGETLEHRGDRVRVRNVVEIGGHALAMDVTERRPALVLDDIRFARLGTLLEYVWDDEYWLLDRSTGEGIRAHGGSMPITVRIAGVAIVLRRYVFYAALLHRASAPDRRADWLSHVAVARIADRPVASFRRNMIVTEFPETNPPTLKDAQPPQLTGNVLVRGEVGHSESKPSVVSTPRTVIDALRGAAGLLITADLQNVRLIRDSSPETQILDLTPFFNGTRPANSYPTIRPGDVIEVAPLLP